MLLVVELLDARDLVASLDPSATKFGFCDRGVELASLIHVSAHSGATSGLFRKAKRWLREANMRLDMWQVVPGSNPWQVVPGPNPVPQEPANIQGVA